MAVEASTGGPVVFKEAIDYFRQKVNLPTRTWTDLWQGMHSRAFVVAGATSEALLSDFRAAIDKAISQGTTLAEFRKDFDRIAATHGWSYNGSRGWRSAVIYNTNLRMAHSAGRWAQISRAAQAAEARGEKLYLRYVAILDSRTRPLHRAWHGTILPWDDPWWDQHFPPNGWNCRCTIQIVTEADLKRYGWKVSATAPESPTETVTINTLNGPVTVETPQGVDAGFGYNPGKTAWGAPLAEDVMDAWRASGADAYRSLTPGDWRSAGRPADIPVDQAKAKPIPPPAGEDGVRRAIEAAIGGGEATFTLPDGSPLLVDAAALASHLDAGRAPFAPLLPELVNDPYEIWLSFEQHLGTGKVFLRKRIIKAVDIQGRQLLLVAQSVGGRFEAWTFLPTTRSSYIAAQRRGWLVWARGDGTAGEGTAGANQPGGGASP